MNTTDRTDQDALRQHVHGMWAGVAPRWAEHADYVDERGADLTAELLDGAGVEPGDRVLELACGPGSAGLAAARRIAPSGNGCAL